MYTLAKRQFTRLFLAWALLATGVCCVLGDLLPSANVPAATSGGALVEDVKVPMADGVGLATTIYWPAGEGPWPTLLLRTPYSRSGESGWGRTLPEHGIVVMTQDVRGRFDSEGEDMSFFAEREDGQATLRWIAGQPWSNGRVMTLGGSALGITQYLFAPGAPEALTCQWIQVATPDLFDGAVYQGGVYREALTTGWLESNQSTHRIAPLRSHHKNDAYWDIVQIDDFSAVNVPAFHVAGWYDIFARGMVNGFLGYQDEGGAGARGQQHLIMGPWTHAVNDPEVGALTFPNAVLESLEQQLEIFMLACLFDDPEAQADLAALPPVQYFTLGAVAEPDAPGNVWRTAGTWPPAGGTETPFYLHPGNVLSLERPGADGGGDAFTYDPHAPSPTVGGANLGLPAGSFDQREVEARDDVVVYTTPPLEAPLEATGDLRADIWIATDVPDTDVVVRLTDVYPDGRSMLVSDSIFRARYRTCPDYTCEVFLEPGEPVLLTVDLGPHSYVFNTGHRVRISVTSSNAPRFAPNPNNGEMYVGEGAPAQVAHTVILHDADHPSALMLPVFK
ncbi:MAG: CocE/NonD family hydrolase [Anaerolineae bacterium]|nr:CocE/NonD family hydrolase [Anaerolineae bacterium]